MRCSLVEREVDRPAGHRRWVQQRLDRWVRRVDRAAPFPSNTPSPARDRLAGSRPCRPHATQVESDEVERQFLLSLVAIRPEWPLLKIPHLERMPGIRWKLQNLARLQKSDPMRFTEQFEMLAKLLG